ncbi:hypothetical protein ACTA71_007769 [Dictyostelium dimigraforme]
MSEGANRQKIFISLDGGGTRGLMTIQILAHLEKELGRNIGDLCDIIAGTSAGGIISFCKMNGIDNESINELYKSIGKKVTQFNCTNITESQSIANTNLLIDELSRLFSGNVKDFAKHRKGFVLTCLSPTLLPVDYKAYMISNYDNDNRFFMEPKKMMDLPVVDAIRATSGIPILFNVPRYQGKNFLDGGYLNNNPTPILYQEAISLFGGENSKDFIFISIGTGRKPSNPNISSKLMSGAKLPFKVANSVVNNVTGIELDSPVHRIVKFMTTSGEESHLQFKNSHPDLSYFRFDSYIDRDIAVNDASDETIEYMKKSTNDYLNSEECKKMISDLKKLLI